MKKIIKTLIFAIALFIGISSAKATIYECKYKGTWRDLYGHTGNTIHLTLPIDTEKKDGLPKEEFQTDESSPITIVVWNYYRYISEYFFEDCFGVNSSGKAKYNSLYEYYMGTKSCPDKLTIFDNYSQGQGYAAIPNNGYYKNIYNHKVLADLEVVNQTHSESNDNPNLQCGYTVKLSDDSYKFNITYGSDVSASANVHVLDPENFNSNTCYDQVYACIETARGVDGDKIFITKEKDTMFISGKGYFNMAFGVNASDLCKTGDYERCARNDGTYCQYVSQGETGIVQATSGCEKIDQWLDKIETGDANDRYYYRDEITNYCSYYLSQMGYNSGSCMKTCLNLNKLYPNIFINKIERKCGFSLKLVTWIENIMRWVKYIVPALLIILTILDFIKAMTGEKEDEMKKAQKNLVIRLIAIALIFLVPMIVDFILDKMGFSTYGCSLF